MGFALLFGRRQSGAAGRRAQARDSYTDTQTVPQSNSISESDAALIDRIQRGEEGAFDTMFLQYYAPLCEYALSLHADTGQAEDIVSDILTTVWAQRATWSPKVGIGPYLFRSVRNRVANVLRDSARVIARESTISADIPRVVQPDAELEARERAKIVTDALIRLSPRRRLLAQLRWGQHLSYPEIALRLGVSTAAVQMQMTRLLDVLRELIPDDLA